MMVPQTLPDGAQLEVVFVDENQSEHTLTADLKLILAHGKDGYL